MNEELAKIFKEVAVILEIKNIPFKPRAYEKVAYTINLIQENIEDVYKNGGLKALGNIPGVGESIAQKIEEYIKTGHIKEYDKLKREIPVDIEKLKKVEGIGPKTISRLYKKLGIRTLAQLEKAA